VSDLQHYLLCILPSAALGFAVVETAAFYVHGGALVRKGFAAIWRTPKTDPKGAQFGPIEWWVSGSFFALTAYAAMVYRGNPSSSRVEQLGTAAFVFAATLFVARFVALREKEDFRIEFLIALIAAALSLVFTFTIGTVATTATVFVWFAGHTALVRYLRGIPNAPLHLDDTGYYVKDTTLISLIFVLAAGAYRYVSVAGRIDHVSVLIGAFAIVMVAVIVVIWEFQRNTGQHGVDESERKIRRFAPELLKGDPDSRKSETQRVKHAILDHIMIRDTTALLVCVVAPFVITIVVLSIMPQLGVH
jgi:hypothetical protein